AHGVRGALHELAHLRRLLDDGAHVRVVGEGDAVLARDRREALDAAREAIPLLAGEHAGPSPEAERRGAVALHAARELGDHRVAPARRREEADELAERARLHLLAAR